MINPKTIISTTDDSYTLLQWLKKIDKALSNDALETVEIIQVDETHIKLKFVFKSGEFVTSNEINIGQGVTIEQIQNLIKGSDTVIFDLDETNTKLEIRLDNDIINKLARALLLPVSSLGQKALVGIDHTNSQAMFKFGDGLEVDGSTSPYTIKASGGSEVKTYRHKLKFDYTFNDFPLSFYSEIFTTSPIPFTIQNFPHPVLAEPSATAAFSAVLSVHPSAENPYPDVWEYYATAKVISGGGPVTEGTLNLTQLFTDTVTEL